MKRQTCFRPKCGQREMVLWDPRPKWKKIYPFGMCVCLFLLGKIMAQSNERNLSLIKNYVEISPYIFLCGMSLRGAKQEEAK